LKKGYRVTGSDFSEAMLLRASQQFPQVTFIQKATTMLRNQAAFDGICSFNSTLYLDPIDLLHSIYRFHNALKPSGLLFLFGFDSGPDWRGEPFSHRIGQWMWSWHYGMEETARLLEEHGYFKVIEAQKVQVDEKEAERIALELTKQKQEEEEYYQRQESAQSPVPLPFFKTPVERSPYAFVVIARRCEK
jgi:trans-aconitate methyltransferase